MTANTDNHECPCSQEPEIGGNSGNGGNNQQGRGFQPFPPNKKTGNKWEHTIVFQYKTASHLPILVITVPTKIGVGTTWEQKNTPRGHGLSGLFPPFPLFPPFLNSQQHVYVSNPGEVAQ
jgi:hypothetical protein